MTRNKLFIDVIYFKLNRYMRMTKRNGCISLTRPLPPKVTGYVTLIALEMCRKKM